MKSLSASFAFAGLVAAAIIVIASCSTQWLPANQSVEVTIGDPNAKPPKYVELKHGLADEHALQCALYKLKSKGGVCEITFLRSADGTPDTAYCSHLSNINCTYQKGHQVCGCKQRQ